MNAEQQKAAAFVGRLLSNPAISNLPPLQKEEQIIQFLKVNAPQLRPTLASPQFFGNRSWQEIFNILYRALQAVINQELIPAVERMIQNRIDFSFIPFLRQQQVDNRRVAEQLNQFLVDLISHPPARQAFSGPFTAVLYGFVDRYIEEIFNRRSYAQFEFTKVERLKMSKEEIKHMVKVVALLRPSVNLLTTSIAGEQFTGNIQSQYLDKVLGVIKDKLSYLPEQVLKSALNSNLSFQSNRYIEATGRAAAILSLRCKSFRPNQKVDRGADTPDKSWFNIARRNYKYYGFDVKMLDEFYKTAAENQW
ncbi:MAG: hypothetical protein K9L68_04895 [Spirochaetales bacterium]|nr:hypothetical protein [Spirochaetales bacterium]MCF7937915.1 hypothetical protein [Spirochaetales bacterium]